MRAHSAHDPRIGRAFHENRFLQALVAGYALVFAWSAIAPKYPRDWWLEMLLAFAFIATLIATHRRFVFSNLSYALIALFLALHTFGAHYTYAESRVWGLAEGRARSLERNHYDRIVHFSFGAVLVYPLHEIARRVLHLRGGWAYLGAVARGARALAAATKSSRLDRAARLARSSALRTSERRATSGMRRRT